MGRLYALPRLYYSYGCRKDFVHTRLPVQDGGNICFGNYAGGIELLWLLSPTMSCIALGTLKLGIGIDSYRPFSSTYGAIFHRHKRKLGEDVAHKRVVIGAMDSIYFLPHED